MASDFDDDGNSTASSDGSESAAEDAERSDSDHVSSVSFADARDDEDTDDAMDETTSHDAESGDGTPVAAHDHVDRRDEASFGSNDTLDEDDVAARGGRPASRPTDTWTRFNARPWENEQRRHVTPAIMEREEVDFQGIPWREIGRLRDAHRRERCVELTAALRQNWRCLTRCERGTGRTATSRLVRSQERQPPAVLDANPPQSLPDYCGTYYRFRRTTLRAEAAVAHFQLRHLAAAPTNNDLYYSGARIVYNYTAKDQTIRPAIKLWKDVQRDLQITTLAATPDLLAIGGFQGELVCKNMQTGDIVFNGNLAVSHNAITNGLDFVELSSGATALLAGNNDERVRVVDVNHFDRIVAYQMPWAVNVRYRPGRHSEKRPTKNKKRKRSREAWRCCLRGGKFVRLNPNRRLLCAVGDGVESVILDVRTGNESFRLQGHQDNLFSCAWTPDGITVATASEDWTTRLYDIRQPNAPFKVLRSIMEVPRSLQYTSDGRFLVIGEGLDLVSIVDAASGYTEGQLLDFFGDIGGVALTPDAETLTVCNCDLVFGCLIEFEREGPLSNLEAFCV